MLSTLSKWYAQPTNQQGIAILVGALASWLSHTLSGAAALSVAAGGVMLIIKNDNTASTAANAAVAAGAAPAVEATKAAGVAATPSV